VCSTAPIWPSPLDTGTSVDTPCDRTYGQPETAYLHRGRRAYDNALSPYKYENVPLTVRGWGTRIRLVSDAPQNRVDQTLVGGWVEQNASPACTPTPRSGTKTRHVTRRDCRERYICWYGGDWGGGANGFLAFSAIVGFFEYRNTDNVLPRFRWCRGRGSVRSGYLNLTKSNLVESEPFQTGPFVLMSRFSGWRRLRGFPAICT